MHTIYLALGANIGDKNKAVKHAIKLLSKEIMIEQEAPIYETKPWGYSNQGNFLNTVIKGKTILSPEELLLFVKKIEKTVGRIQRFTNGPREMDIDILLYDSLIFRSSRLTIPHNAMHVRDFVLQPLADIAPRVIHPVIKKTIAELLQEIPQNERVIIKQQG